MSRTYRIVLKKYADDTQNLQVEYTDNFDFWNIVSTRNDIESAKKLVQYCKDREIISEEEVWRD